MNILFIIGNGFDLNLNLKTSYLDFCKFYQKQESPTKAIESLKNEISKDIENWSDLELALGKYSKKVESPSIFLEIFEDIGDKLSEYLIEQEFNFDYTKINDGALENDLINPEDYLLERDKERLLSFINKFGRTQHQTNIITFNYTNILEKILEYDHSQIKLGSHGNNLVMLQRIEHVHGYSKRRMVMGVNDISQILNEKFRTDQSLIDAFVKTICNQVQKHMIDDWCGQKISQANVICIFGSSLGLTDSFWWQKIGKQLRNDCRLVIFKKEKIYHPIENIGLEN
ncbi:MAG: hypothetical protein CL663_07355 [Bacteroidetes bacterium]|nr:hypothetical protein [Bacteroidota bacterium]